MSGNDPVVCRIEAALAVLEPSLLQIRDDSALHAGHPGAQGGGGHYTLEIDSPQFAGQSAVARHRMIYAALGSLMGGTIHALAIIARAPGEAAAGQAPGPRSTRHM